MYTKSECHCTCEAGYKGEVYHCPRHAAADDMYEVLKATRVWLALMEANIPLHGKLLKDINKALAEADREPKGN